MLKARIAYGFAWLLFGLACIAGLTADREGRDAALASAQTFALLAIAGALINKGRDRD